MDRASLSVGFSRWECWSGLSFRFCRWSSIPRKWTWVSCIADSLLPELQVKPRRETIVCLLLWLLHQPGEKLFCVWLCYGCCYHCCISQERVNVSAVPTAPQLFFQPLSLCLAYPGFSGQCEQQDNWSSNRMISDAIIISIFDINDIQQFLYDNKICNSLYCVFAIVSKFYLENFFTQCFHLNQIMVAIYEWLCSQHKCWLIFLYIY